MPQPGHQVKRHMPARLDLCHAGTGTASVPSPSLTGPRKSRQSSLKTGHPGPSVAAAQAEAAPATLSATPCLHSSPAHRRPPALPLATSLSTITTSLYSSGSVCVWGGGGLSRSSGGQQQLGVGEAQRHPEQQSSGCAEGKGGCSSAGM